MSLKTNYKDDVLDTSKNVNRRYVLTNNSDNTVSLTDVTSYSQEGDTFGAGDINATNQKVNEIEQLLGQQATYSWNASTATLTITSK